MDKEAAVRSRVAVVRGVLSDADIAQLDALYAAIKREALERSGGSEVFDHPNLVGLAASEHHTAFLHVERRIDRELPHIRDKVLAAMRDADAAHWSLLAPRPDGGGEGGEAGRANIRVCEYHEYLPGGEVCDPRHCDGGSLVTMSVLLCQPEEFTGGTFTTLEADGSVTAFGDAEFGKTSTHARFGSGRAQNRWGTGRGDGLVFVSEKWHSVEVVESGNRRTLVTELWEHPRCVADRDT